jgi:hypothetical protein
MARMPLLLKLRDPIRLNGFSPLVARKPPQVAPAATGSRLWLPSDLGPKLQTWLKGDDLTGSNGDPISTWTDASGNTNNGTGATNNPTLVAGGLNGMNTVAFAAASAQYFTLPTGLLGGRTQSASFAVYKLNTSPPTSDTSAGPVFGDWGSSAQGNHNPYLDGVFYDDYCSNARRSVSGVPASTAFRIFGLRANSSAWALDVNGTNYFTDTSNTFSTSTAPLLGHATGTGGNVYLNGQIAEVIDCNDYLTTAEKEQVEGYLAWKWGLQASLPVGHTYASAAPTVSTGSGGNAYSLSCAAGSFALSGQSATLSIAMPASSGSFALTGNAITPAVAMSAAAASFALTGLAAGLTAQRRLIAASGSFTFTGNAAGLAKGVRMAAASGFFALTGSAASFLVSRKLAASFGTFTITGNAASLRKGFTLGTSAASFVLTGKAAGLLAQRKLVLASGSFVLSGNTVALPRGRTLVGSAAAFTLTGRTIALDTKRSAATGAFLLSGGNASFSSSRVASLGVGSFVISGSPALLKRSLTISLGRGLFAFVGYGTVISHPNVVTPATRALAGSLDARTATGAVADRSSAGIQADRSATGTLANRGAVGNLQQRRARP